MLPNGGIWRPQQEVPTNEDRYVRNGADGCSPAVKSLGLFKAFLASGR